MMPPKRKVKGERSKAGDPDTLYTGKGVENEAFFL
jgi:hypothetical protein